LYRQKEERKESDDDDDDERSVVSPDSQPLQRRRLKGNIYKTDLLVSLHMLKPIRHAYAVHLFVSSCREENVNDMSRMLRSKLNTANKLDSSDSILPGQVSRASLAYCQTWSSGSSTCRVLTVDSFR